MDTNLTMKRPMTRDTKFSDLPMGAFWLKPSLYHISYKDNQLLNFIGMHKTRKYTKEMDYYKKDPRMYAPKMNFSLYTAASWESFPIYVEDSSILIAGAILLDSMNNSGDSTLRDQASFLLKNWESKAEFLADPYFKANPQGTGFIKMLEMADRFGYTDIIDHREPIWREEDVEWFKDCNINMSRALQGNEDQVTKELVILGKDTKYNQVVVGLKKEFTWKKQMYSRIVPLKGNGSYLLADIMLMITHPPSDGGRRYNVMSESTFERCLQDNIKKMENMELKRINLTMKFRDFTSQMCIENGRL